MKTLSAKIYSFNQVDFISVYNVKQFIKDVEEWCSKNNTIPLKDSKLRLAITDGGWVNCRKLLEEINRLSGEIRKD